MNLVELLITIGIAAILTAMGVSSYKYVTNSSRVSSEINGLLGDMQVARSEAIKRGQYVTVCPSSDGATCQTAGTWASGWIVFTDFNANGTVDTGAPDYDTILRIQPPWASSTGSTDTLSTNNNAVHFVVFNRNGLAVGADMPSDGSDFVIKLQTNPANTQWQRCLDITTTGAMQTEHYGDSSGNCQ